MREGIGLCTVTQSFCFYFVTGPQIPRKKKKKKKVRGVFVVGCKSPKKDSKT